MKAIGGEGIQAIFARADGDGNGMLSVEEASNLVEEIQAVLEERVVSGAEMAELVEYIDLDGNAQV